MKKRKIKRLIAAILMGCMILSVNVVAFAKSDANDISFYESYQKVLQAARDYDVPIDMSFEEYKEQYTPEYGSYEQYAETYIELFETDTSALYC